MSDDENTTQNPISEETTPKDGQDSIPPSPQEPMADAPIPPIDSEHTDALLKAPGAPTDSFSKQRGC